jgi:two-component system cell cycle sensor histidine kinase/response regulator CckA
VHEDLSRLQADLIDSQRELTTRNAQLERAYVLIRQLNEELEQRVQSRTSELRDLYELAPVGYHSLDADGLIVQINETASEWLGYRRDELEGIRSLRELLAPSSQRAYDDFFPRFKAQGQVRNQEIDIVHRDGSIFPALLNCDALYDAHGNFQRSRSVLVNLAERRASNQALRESEERFRIGFQRHSASMLLVDAVSGLILDANEAAERFYGHSPETLRQTHVQDLDPSPPEEVAARRQTVVREGRHAFVTTHRLANGELRTVEVHSSAITFNQRPVLYSVIHDITSRVQAEAAVRAGEARFRQLFLGMPMAGVIYRLVRSAQREIVDWEIVDINALGAANVGHPREALLGQRAVALFGAEVMQPYLERCRRVVATNQAEHFETHFAFNDRHYLSGVFLIDADHYANVSVDITDHRRAEQRQRESDARVREVMEHSVDASYKRNLRTGALEYLSPVIERMLGYSADEMMSLPREAVMGMVHPDDVPALKQVIAAARVSPSGSRHSVEYRLRRKADETYLWVHDQAVLLRDEHGQPATLVGSMSDISARKQADEAGRQNEVFFRTALDYTADWEYWVGPDRQLVFMSPSCERITGHRAEEFLANPGLLSDIVHPDDRHLMTSHEGEGVDSDSSASFDFRIVTTSGEIRWVNHSCQVVYGSTGERLGRRVSNRDVTERLLAMESLRLAEERLSGIIEGTHVGTWEWNIPTGELALNERWAEIVGLTLAELEPLSINVWENLAHPDDLKRSGVLLAKHISGEDPYYDFECRMRHKDGHWVWVHDRGRVTTWDANGKPVRMSGTHTDITARVLATENQKASDDRFHKLFNAAPVLIAVSVPATGQLLEVNDAFCRITGWTRPEALGRTSQDLGFVNAEQRRAGMAASLKSGQIMSFMLAFPGKDGRVVRCLFSGELVELRGQSVLLTIGLDLTEAYHAERALKASAERFDQISAAANDLIWEVDADGLYTFVSPSSTSLLGYDPEELVSRLHFHELWPADQAAALLPDVRAAINRREEILNLRNILLHKTGRRVLVETTGFPNVSADGTLLGYRGVDRDITEREESVKEQQRLEKELNHLQRLESLGRLASGVSHDMNNVLGAIMAVSSLLKLRHKGDPELSADAEALLQAATRGRDLVKGLRDFSRKELDAATELDLNEMVQREAHLLERTTLKRISIVLALAPDLPAVFGEASTIGNALMNLCMNAVDAMPRGGTLTLSTLDLGHGFVELAVQDDGEGMTPEVLNRAMEPFFTTKPSGKGTGLGLSQVFGAVRMHGGTLDIRSEPRKGTQVRMTLPALESLRPEPGETVPDATSSSRSLRILFVDDEEMVRNTVMRLFRFLGHDTQASSSGLDALRRVEGGLEIDLVVLDLSMPGMDGEETLSRLRILRPALPVLIATGFADDRIPSILKRFPDVRLLKKPYEIHDVEQVLRGWP